MLRAVTHAGGTAECSKRHAVGMGLKLVELLLKASCLDLSSKEFQAEASKIVKELFCLPLAIDQAGAYIASGATTIGDYHTKYSEQQKILLSHADFTGASQYNRTVYETWELSYKEIQRRAKSDS